MSKPTTVRDGAVVAKRTQRNGNTTLGGNSVNTNAIQNKAVTLDKLADQANYTLWAQDGFDSFVIAEKLVPVNGVPSVGQFRSEISGRAPIADPGKNLAPLHGVKRIMTQHIERALGESGPNGEMCFRVPNDPADSIRFVGNWAPSYNLAGRLIAAPLAQTNNFFEIVFWGTGLNILVNPAGGAVDWRATIDGGPEGSNFLPGQSILLQSADYESNCIIPVVANLSPGLHTVKIRKADTISDCQIHGFEIINNGTDLKIRPGSAYVSGAKVDVSTEVSSTLNSGFTNQYGTPGTRGGKVIVYLTQDGQIQKDIRWTETAQLNLASANHTNEEVVKKAAFREFGRGRPTANEDPDGVINAVSSTRSLNLSDNATGLLLENCFSSIPANQYNVEAVHADAGTTKAITISFIGTGLDVTTINNISASTLTYDVFVDGISVGSYSVTNAISAPIIQKIVSGLPFGTHTVRFQNASGVNFGPGIVDFIIYGPKTPELPSGAIKISEYNLVADFAANSTTGALRVSTGVIRKYSYREFTYVEGTGGTTSWSFTNGGAPDSGTVGFYSVHSDRLNAYVELTFWGTGMELRSQIQSNNSNNIQVSLQSLSTGGSLLPATTTNFSSMVTSVYGTGAAFNSSTGVLDFQDAILQGGAGFILRGLPLGLWKIRFNNGTAGLYPRIDVIDVICPIYSYTDRSPSFADYNTMIGNNSLSDQRVFAPTVAQRGPKNWNVTLGHDVNPTTTSTAFVPVPNMKATIKTNGGPIEIFFQLSAFSPASRIQYYDLHIDGRRVDASLTGTGVAAAQSPSTGSAIQCISFSTIQPVEAGFHTIQVLWKIDAAGTLTIEGPNHILTVKEL